MKTRLIAVLTVLAAGAGAQQQQGTPPPASAAAGVLERALSETDARIARASAMLDQLEADFARRRKGVKDPKAACAADFSVDAFMRDWAAGRYAKYATTFSGQYTLPLREYHIFKAAKAGSAAECAPLKAFPEEYDKKPSTMDRGCLEISHRMLMARALVQKSPDFPRLCAEHLAYNAPDVAANAQAICAVMAEQRDNPGAMCARLAPHLRGPQPRLKECQQTAGQYSGDGRSCPAIEDEISREQCLATVAYHKAWRAKSPEACQGNSWCRVMMGDPGPAAAAGRKLGTLACGLTDKLTADYDPTSIQKDFHDKGAAILSLLDDAKTRLINMEAALALPDLRTAQAVDARVEKAARVKDRYQKAFRALSPPAGRGVR